MRGFGKIGSIGIRRWAVLGAMGVLLVAVVVMMSSCSSMSKAKFSTAPDAMRTTAGGPPMPPGIGGPGMPGMGGGPGGMPGPPMSAKSAVVRSAQRGESSDAGMPGSDGETSYPPVGSAESSLLIIKTGDITLKVKNIEMAGNQITGIARSVGGFVTNSAFTRAEDEEAVPFGTMTIRVPVDAFERVISAVGKIGEVTAKNLNGEDVTGQVFDLESRLRNKRAEEAQYVQIMKQAKKIPDIISVSDQLFHVRGEIEQIQGRIKYLRSASDMSSITVTLNEPQVATEKGIPGAWQRAVDSLKGTSESLLGGLIWIGVFAPYWIAVLILLWVLVRLIRKRLS
jgi:hypothetical protein